MGPASALADGAPGCVQPRPGTLWSNGPCDGLYAFTSNQYTAALSLAADDFEVPPGCQGARIDEVRFQVTNFPVGANPGRSGVLNFYSVFFPNNPEAVIPFEADPVAVGEMSLSAAFVVYEYTVPTPGLTLAPGRHLLAPHGIVDDNEGAEWLLASTRDGEVLLTEGQVLQDGVWYPLSEHPVASLQGARDLAFEVDGACIVFADGFESGNLSAWSASAG